MTQAEKSVSWFKLLYLQEKCVPWIVYLLAIFSRSRVRELLNFCDRFELSGKRRKQLVRQKTEVERIALDMLRRPFMKPSEVYWLLCDLENEGLLYLMAIARKKYIQQAVSQYVTNLRNVQPLINGRDLKELGYKPGPNLRTMLNHVIEAQLNGKVHTRAEAIDLVKQRYPLSRIG